MGSGLGLESHRSGDEEFPADSAEQSPVGKSLSGYQSP
jgi:hypothetical protein